MSNSPPPRGGPRPTRRPSADHSLGGTTPPPDGGRPSNPTLYPHADGNRLSGSTLIPPADGSRPGAGPSRRPPSDRPSGTTTPPPPRAYTLPPSAYTTPPPRSSEIPAFELERNDYLVVRYAEQHRLMLITRTSRDYDTLDDLRRTFERVLQTLQGIPRGRTSLLIDSRRAPPRNDPEFEVAFAPLRKATMSHFGQNALLMQSAVGVLQVQRHARNDGIVAGAFISAFDALLYLGLNPDERLLQFLAPAEP
ncbi:hypothetical protein [Chondromyces crocatus]|uniref:Uncharacterized protein n=1 Tax=Chondromyces crocatus TaxID=52 RepID=A0A0K1E975_CHOCO|nr:hypothetical protein [Chondromyces crocatus]AKT37425.1 uncharacterized protein CMC5_015660 [Chondromyces crocatus]